PRGRARACRMDQFQLDLVPAGAERSFELEVEIAFAVGDRFGAARAQPGAGNFVRLEPLPEADQVAPAAVGVGAGTKAFVLEHAAAEGEPVRGAVPEVRQDDQRIGDDWSATITQSPPSRR